MTRPDKISNQDYIQLLEATLKKYESSPYFLSYMTLYNQIEDWNTQLTMDGTVLPATEFKARTSKGKIDLFGDGDSKEFDRAFKYFDKMVDLLKQLDEIRKLMTPEEAKEAAKLQEEKKIGVAERIALNAQNK